MEIVCPKCQSVYRFSSEVNTGGKDLRFRCTLCKNVFLLTGEELEALVEKNEDFNSSGQDLENEKNVPQKEMKKGKKLLAILLGIILLCVIIALLWVITPVLDGVKGALGRSEVSEELEVEDEFYKQVDLLELENVRQYSIINEKIGEIIVIEGKITNYFDKSRANVVVEASILDSKENVLVSKELLAGSSASVFQLEVLSEDELERVLSDAMNIELYNADVPPEASVPFMIIFYELPEGAVDFNLKVIGAEVKEVAAEAN